MDDQRRDAVGGWARIGEVAPQRPQRPDLRRAEVARGLRQRGQTRPEPRRALEARIRHARFTQIAIDAFPSEFDVPLNDSLLGITYRHRTSKHTWLETGFQHLTRKEHGGSSPLATTSPSAPEDRQESRVFLDTIIDL